jgi:hypothetical protein
MKVTAMIEDNLIEDAIKYSKAKNITQAVKAALQEYIAIEKTKELNALVEKENLEFTHTADQIRKLNREI